MTDTRKKFSCPECMGIAKVPIKHLGKRIKCPNCDFVFRAGPKQQPKSEILAELEEEDTKVPAAIPADVFANPAAPASQPLHAPQYVPTSLPPTRPAATAYKSHLTKTPKCRKKEMTDSDQNLQSTGFFLIFIPLIATVLPLFGVQLRRLAKAGEFAPLAAMLVGFVGVGFICYARRNQGDATMFGAAASVLVLLSGIGGFFIVSGLSDSGNNGTKFTKSRAEIRADRERHRERLKQNEIELAERKEMLRKQAKEDRQRSAAAREENAKRVKRLRREFNQLPQDQQQRMQEEANRLMRQAEESRRRANTRAPNFPN